jgi:hypothetical protein
MPSQRCAERHARKRRPAAQRPIAHPLPGDTEALHRHERLRVARVQRLQSRRAGAVAVALGSQQAQAGERRQRPSSRPPGRRRRCRACSCCRRRRGVTSSPRLGPVRAAAGGGGPERCLCSRRRRPSSGAAMKGRRCWGRWSLAEERHGVRPGRQRLQPAAGRRPRLVLGTLLRQLPGCCQLLPAEARVGGALQPVRALLRGGRRRFATSSHCPISSVKQGASWAWARRQALHPARRMRTIARSGTLASTTPTYFWMAARGGMTRCPSLLTCLHLSRCPASGPWPAYGSAKPPSKPTCSWG